MNLTMAKGNHLVLFSLFLFLCMQYSSANYQFFKFVQQWPTSTCNVKNVGCKNFPSVSNFTIHGLWGTNKTRPYPAFCGTTPYDPNTISSLKSQMSISWPDIIKKQNDDHFWEHEWKKHGTCSEKRFNQFAYFNLALKIKDSVDVLEVLKRGGINPTRSRKYPHLTVAQVIESHINAEPELRCNQDKQGTVQLHEVVICKDDQGKNFIDCPQSSDGPVGLCRGAPIAFFP